MELFSGGELERRAMERCGCLNYSCSKWESEKADIYERQAYYRFDKFISRYGGEVTSTQQKTKLSDRNAWLIEEVVTLHGVPFGDYFNVSIDAENLIACINGVHHTFQLLLCSIKPICFGFTQSFLSLHSLIDPCQISSRGLGFKIKGM